MRPLRILLATVLLTFGVAAAPAGAAIPSTPSQWYALPGLNALGGAQWVRALAYGTPPNIVYAGLEGGGVFKSVNGGATWSAFNSGFANPLTTNVRALLTSSTGTTVYAGTDLGIFKSTGGAWQPVAQGPEPNPASPTKLNQSVQSLVSLSVPNVMLAGVFSGGVYKSTDGGATWSPPPANSGMPVSETVYGLTENVPGLVYATAGSGVYVSTNQGTTWTRVSDGIPGSASPITTWVYPQRPQVLFTSTGSNGIYRSVNAGLTWTEINAGLGAVRARGMQIFTGVLGAHVYAATENGLWESLTENSVNPPPPNWHKVTETGLGSNLIMWSLSAPVIPGVGGPGVIAGTQSDGGFFLAFEPVDSPCPTSHTTNVTANCPQIVDTTPSAGQSVTIQNGFTTQRGTWTGTPVIEYAYQWQRCTTAVGGCSDIPDAEETSYLIPENESGYFFRIRVSASNPAPTYGNEVRFSAITSAAGAAPSTLPGFNQLSAPGISVLAPGETTSPQVGDTMYAEYGITPGTFTDGWFNPKATSYAYRWLRCDGSGNDCNEIPGATSRSYTLQPADGTRDLRVRVTGTNGSGSAIALSGPSYDVTSTPATIADPFPDPDGGPAKSQAPSIAGDAYVGETLAGSVGGWNDPTTDFLRRWVRCDAGGSSCSTIQKVASTDPEDGSTYVVRDSDVGSTLRMRVTADVNNDLTPDGIDNHLPHSVEVDTAATAVVSFRPGAGGPGGGGPGGTGAADVTAPAISGLRLTTKAFAVGKTTTFKLRLSEPGSVRVLITRSARGRKVGGRCRPKTTRNRRAKVCTYQKTVGTITRGGRPAGDLAIVFNGKLGKRRLAPGSYRATFVVTDAAGNTSKAATLVFRIIRR